MTHAHENPPPFSLSDPRPRQVANWRAAGGEEEGVVDSPAAGPVRKVASLPNALELVIEEKAIKLGVLAEHVHPLPKLEFCAIDH